MIRLVLQALDVKGFLQLPSETLFVNTIEELEDFARKKEAQDSHDHVKKKRFSIDDSRLRFTNSEVCMKVNVKSMNMHL